MYSLPDYQAEIKRLAEKKSEAAALRIEMQEFSAALRQEVPVQQTNRENYALWQRQTLQRAIVIVTVVAVLATAVAGMVL